MNVKIVLVASAVMAFAGALTVAGCGDDCAAGAAHYTECVPNAPSDTTAECTGQAQCKAVCVSAASCDTLLANGKDTEGDQAYVDCIDKCGTAN